MDSFLNVPRKEDGSCRRKSRQYVTHHADGTADGAGFKTLGKRRTYWHRVETLPTGMEWVSGYTVDHLPSPCRQLSRMPV